MTPEPAGIDLHMRQFLLLLALFTWLRLPSVASQNASGSWPIVNLDPGATRYSPLTQITPENVGHLESRMDLSHEARAGRWQRSRQRMAPL